MELRRLCELLRNHLISLPKYSHQAYAINLNSAESMQMHLETRFLQLNTASSLELWQEAFRSIEDIHGLVQLSRKPPKAALMVNYYEQLSKIFLVSGNLLFHAISLCKHFALANRDPSKYTAEEMKRVANAVLLSALAIPLEQRAGGASLLESMEEASFRNQKLVDILGLVRMPSRQELLDDAVS